MIKSSRNLLIETNDGLLLLQAEITEGKLHFLMPAASDRYIGTSDVDLAIRPERLDIPSFMKMKELLESHGYQWMADRFAFAREVVVNNQTIAVTGAFVTACLILSPWFIDWIRTPESVRPLAEDYFRIRVLATPLQALGLVFLIAIKAQGRGAMAIGLAFFGVLVNFLLDAALISNYSFSLRLGLIGSAYANVSSQFLLACGATMVYWSANRRMTGSSPATIRLVVRSVLQVGKWSGLESLVRNVGYIIGVVSVVNIVGAGEPAAIGGYNTAMYVMWGLVLIPVLAWTEATNIAIGSAYGHNDTAAMLAIHGTSSVLMGLYMVGWMVLGCFTWQPLSQWLNAGQGVDVANYSSKTFLYLAFPYTLFAIGSGLKSVFVGTGRFAFVTASSAIVNVAIYLPLGLLARSNFLAVDFTDFLIVTIAVFAIDFLVTLLFVWKWGYAFPPAARAIGSITRHVGRVHEDSKSPA